MRFWDDNNNENNGKYRVNHFNLYLRFGRGSETPFLSKVPMRVPDGGFEGY